MNLMSAYTIVFINPITTTKTTITMEDHITHDITPSPFNTVIKARRKGQGCSIGIIGGGTPIGHAVATRLTETHDIELVCTADIDNEMLSAHKDILDNESKRILERNSKDVSMIINQVHFSDYKSGKEARRERRKLKRKKK